MGVCCVTHAADRVIRIITLLILLGILFVGLFARVSGEELYIELKTVERTDVEL